MLAGLLTIANDTFDYLKEKYPPESINQGPEAKVGKVFNRFYVDEKGYKSYLIVLAICCLLSISDEKEFKNQNVKTFAAQIDEILNNRPEELKQALEKMFRAVAINVTQRFSEKEKDLDDEISQNLFKYLRSTQFNSFYLTYGML